jgi:hypothetical protein
MAEHMPFGDELSDGSEYGDDTTEDWSHYGPTTPSSKRSEIVFDMPAKRSNIVFDMHEHWITAVNTSHWSGSLPELSHTTSSASSLRSSSARSAPSMEPSTPHHSPGHNFTAIPSRLFTPAAIRRSKAALSLDDEICEKPDDTVVESTWWGGRKTVTKKPKSSEASSRSSASSDTASIRNSMSSSSTSTLTSPDAWAWDRPGPKVVAAAARCKLEDEWGNTIDFGSLLPTQYKHNADGDFTRLVVFFGGHWWCGLCQEYILDSINKISPEKAAQCGVRIVIVGCGSWKTISNYRKQFKVPFETYVDQGGALYKALGMQLLAPDIVNQFKKGNGKMIAAGMLVSLQWHHRPHSTLTLGGGTQGGTAV